MRLRSIGLIVTLALGLFLAALAADAQLPAKVSTIGYLEPGPLSAHPLEAFRQGLRDLGYVEGQNIAIEKRAAEGKPIRLADLAAELVRLKVDVIFAVSPPAIHATKNATRTIPIVFVGGADPVGDGLVASLARPGGNITGSTFFDPELTAKRLELLKEAMPRVAQVAALLNPDNPASIGPVLQAMQIAAKSMKVGLQQFEVLGPNEFDSAFAAMANRRVDAVAVLDDGVFLANARAIADVAAKNRLPLIGNKEFAEAGGLIGYGVNFLELWRRAAYFVDRILKGAKPGDLPVEQATKFELIINMKTARALGIKIPDSILVRANKVIE